MLLLLAGLDKGNCFEVLHLNFVWYSIGGSLIIESTTRGLSFWIYVECMIWFSQVIHSYCIIYLYIFISLYCLFYFFFPWQLEFWHFFLLLFHIQQHTVQGVCPDFHVENPSNACRCPYNTWSSCWAFEATFRIFWCIGWL